MLKKRTMIAEESTENKIVIEIFKYLPYSKFRPVFKTERWWKLIMDSPNKSSKWHLDKLESIKDKDIMKWVNEDNRYKGIRTTFASKICYITKTVRYVMYKKYTDSKFELLSKEIDENKELEFVYIGDRTLGSFKEQQLGKQERRKEANSGKK